MAIQSLNKDSHRNELRERMTQGMVWLCRWLTPPGLTPRATRRWLRVIVYAILFVSATTFAVLLAGGFAVILTPDRSNVLKWPGVLFLSLLCWKFVHFFPQVWQNRRDDKFGVVVIALLIAGWAYMIGRVLVD